MNAITKVLQLIAKLTMRGKCKDCEFGYLPTDYDEVYCTCEDSPYYKEFVSPDFSCERWGI